MTESKNKAELKAELKAKTDKLVSQDKELFANLSKEEITEKKKERAKGFREENRELLDKNKNSKLEEINVLTDPECVNFRVKESLDDIYKNYPFLFNQRIGLSTQTWGGYMDDENGRELKPGEKMDHSDRFSSALEILESIPLKNLKFNENDLNIYQEKLEPDVSMVNENDLMKIFEKNGVNFDPTKELPTMDLLSEGILTKNPDKNLLEIIPEGYFKEVQYSESNHYHGLSFLALKGKVYGFGKETTLGDLLKELKKQ